MTVLSFLIVAYKSNATIGQTIESIHAQEGDFQKEIIVIENCSEDDCREIVVSLSPNAQTVVNPRNFGFTRAVNQALSLAGGEYLFLINPDVVLFPNCTALLLQTLAGDSETGFAAPQLLSFENEILASVRNLPSVSTLFYEHSGLATLFPRSRVFGRWKQGYFNYQERSTIEQPMASALLMKGDLVRRVGEWDDRFFVFFSDVDYCRRVKDSGYRIVYEPAAKAYHHGGGSTHQEGTWLIYDSHFGFYAYLEKHELRGWKYLLRPVAMLLLLGSALMRDMRKKFWRRLF